MKWILAWAILLFAAACSATGNSVPSGDSAATKNTVIPHVVRVGRVSLLLASSSSFDENNFITPFKGEYALKGYSVSPHGAVFNIPYNPSRDAAATVIDLASDPSGRLYTLQRASVAIYDTPLSNPNHPSASIEGPNTGLAQNVSMAIDSIGRVYVAFSHEILVFAAGAHGDVAPLARIAGPLTGLETSPYFINQLRLDGFGNVYVVLVSGNHEITTTGRIEVFAANHFGNISPSRVISGPNTGLQTSILSLAVTRDGTIYIADENNLPTTPAPFVAVFAPGADGNVAPMRKIAGSRTKLFWPSGIAVCSDGTMYVTSALNVNSLQPRVIEQFAAGVNGDSAPVHVFGVTAGVISPYRLAF